MVTKSEVHELKQKWKAARQRWLKLLRTVEPGSLESDAAWDDYEEARDEYWKAKGRVSDTKHFCAACKS